MTQTKKRSIIWEIRAARAKAVVSLYREDSQGEFDNIVRGLLPGGFEWKDFLYRVHKV
jgi:hypothetical protein